MFDPQIDRADITFVVQELSSRCRVPINSTAMQEMLARYLKRERQWRQVFEMWESWLKF